MSKRSALDPARVREEIAVTAARMIAEDGADYATAKRKAARQVLGTESRAPGEWLPDNEQVETEVREYQALFQAESQPRVLALLRRIALLLMDGLAVHNPYLAGAVFNGTASEHSDIHLQVFCDSPKDVAIFLLNAGVEFDTTESAHFAGRDEVETLSFLWRGQWPAGADSRELARELRAETGTPVGVHIALYDMNDVRGARRADATGKTQRGDAAAVRALLSQG
ncbi:MAG: UDP-N-acetylmuramate--alanine ligase [Pseudomonadota bacterium]|uniref:UDP-N-acetylmuramate--alanine ligase n=1 Tax=Ralstonia pickettii TaxID=329 RepID=A0A7X2HRF5_RALPI|nr:UDP-N-acetylmuramate--alanine ligase [Ralstonia pickettii]MEE2976897.1 UDP-N-acetylmuramate--alanine ligase [Pseudomonadota bacterium]MRT01365.1 UDP-N-acetylmuramate--alanine ligase [Ralstonia pickettii]NWK46233.1 UDP-N-acetylmuramate--alanine ligase [Ralstonia pickettii]OCS44709.1 UDP-N-acetylmuramate--alanine ligase [Ralstonia pickettii]WKZ84706.1 UDP-N-acetylmuramate--alanine ligase [Ralstonia pickettii]